MTADQPVEPSDWYTHEEGDWYIRWPEIVPLD